ncbi:MAG TPA: O-antigen ligase family protein [Pyrinomonadaceae bacterium]|jgi:hypothetical protein
MSGQKGKSTGHQTISSFSRESNAKGGGAKSFGGRSSGRKALETFKTADGGPAVGSRIEETIGDDAPPARASRAEAADGIRDEPTYAELLKEGKKEKARAKEEKLLAERHWRSHAGHVLTYAGIFLFAFIIYFRPYELIPALSSFNSMAMVVAVATILAYVPTQFTKEGNLTAFTTEVKCILTLVACAVLTIPIARDPALAWNTFSGDFSKVAIIFIIMINTLHSKKRLYGLMWLGIGAAVLLSYQAIGLYNQGIFNTEGYRVSLDFGGMFANPNDLAMHLAIFLPIALTLAFASPNKTAKLLYFIAAGMMVLGIMVTQSRGGFLGFLGMAAVLVWKIGRNQRAKVVLLSSVTGLFLILFAPGNFGLRILSIFIPSLDPTGSSGERKELLIRSIVVTLRNPWGIGMGNFPLVGIQNRQTHNAFTQVSAEIGVIALIAYLVLLISPLLKLRAVEQQLSRNEDFSWLYYLSIGVQASIVAYIISSFFGAVAYNWFIYFPIAFAVGLRRIYRAQQENAFPDFDRNPAPQNG